MQVQIHKSILQIVQGDITRQDTMAIVNAANSSLMGGGGVDGAIHHAGGNAILAECQQIVEKQGRLPTGEAVITTAGKLPAKYVIHTVGPIYRENSTEAPKLLANSYRNSLKLAVAKELTSISFPSISTGAFGYPVAAAAVIALQTVLEFLHKNESIQLVRFILFDDRTFAVYQNELNRILAQQD